MMNTGEGMSRRLLRRTIGRWEQLRYFLCAPLIIAATLVGGGAQPGARAEIAASEEAARRSAGTLFKSRTLRFDQQFASAVVGSPDIVDALPMSDRALYIQGKKVGTTNVSVFDQNMRLIGVIDVEVTPDVGNLQEKIRAGT